MNDNIKVIIDKLTGLKVEVVLIDTDNNPMYFRPLEENETLVNVGTFNNHVKPRYDEKTRDFIESAKPEEIEAARPTPQPKVITEEEKAADLLKVIAINIMNNNELLKTFGIEPRPTA